MRPFAAESVTKSPCRLNGCRTLILSILPIILAVNDFFGKIVIVYLALLSVLVYTLVNVTQTSKAMISIYEVNAESNMTTKKTNRKTFSAEDKERALQMIAEGTPQKEIAAEIGCSIPALQLWKTAAKKAKPAVAKKAAKKAVKKTAEKKTSAKKVKKVAPIAPATTSAAQVSFDEFVHDYWADCAASADKRATKQFTPQAIQETYSILRYAYAKLCGN